MTEEQEVLADEEQSEKVILDEPVETWSPPSTARVPEGSTYWVGEDDGYCRVTRADGTRCAGIRMKETGLCPPHSGRSKILEDPRGMQARSAQGKVRARERRALLADRGITPRSAAREAAIRRSDAVVRALVDDPLDDASLSTMARHKAVLATVELLFPLSTIEAEIEIPADPESMGWSEMQRLALHLAGEGAQG